MTRPQWSAVALASDLGDLARSFVAASGRHHDERERLNLASAAQQTRLVRVLFEQGTYDTDTSIAWLEAGRAYLTDATAPEPADTSNKANTPEGNSR